MKCGLYDESYKIAADTNLLVNYLYNCHLKVAYLHVDEADENGMEGATVHQGKVYEVVFRIPPSPFSQKEFFSTSPSLLQGELHILTKPSLLEKGRM